MTIRERVIQVLERWCGDTVQSTGEELEALWNRTKPTGTPSHNGIDFFRPGAADLVERLRAEYQRPRPELRSINFEPERLDPQNGTIPDIEELFKAISQCPVVSPPAIEAILSTPERAALAREVADIVIAEMAKNKAPKKAGKARKG